MGGAFKATDAAGSDGSDAGVAKALAAAWLERGGAASCGCLEQAPSVANNAKDSRNGADFMGRLSKSLTLLHGHLDKRTMTPGDAARSIKPGESYGALGTGIPHG